MDSVERLVGDLAAADIGSTFNFLRDEDPELDREGGAATRRANLLHYLEARSRATVVAVGEAAGYAGARWSGIAFTSERTLAAWGESYAPSSRRPEGWTEQAATIVHRVLAELDVEETVLLWNTVPTHPRRPHRPLSNRPPRVAEIRAGAAYARRLLDLVQPHAVVAVGRTAEVVGAGARWIRHPSNAGAADFAEGMRRVIDELRQAGRLPGRRGGASLWP